MEKSSEDLQHEITIKQVKDIDHFLKTFQAFEIELGWDPPVIIPYVSLPVSHNQEHYYVGYHKEKPIFSFLFHLFPSEKIAFFGTYYTAPEYRGRGLVYPIFKAKYEELRKTYSKVYWTATSLMSEKYIQKMGSQSFGKIPKVYFSRTKEEKPVKSFIRDLKDKNFSYNLPTWQGQVMEYDLLSVGYDRSECLKTFFSKEDVHVIGSYNSDFELQGFAVMKKTESGANLIGPVTGDSNEVSIDLISALQNKLTEGQKVVVYVAVIDELGEEEKSQRVQLLKNLFFAETKPIESWTDLQGTEKYPHNWKKCFGISFMNHTY
mmetsp:Transcript_26808/g.27843  ORF Transcript_26808/g.27843 Transcript_26808/m.27843 type:complete len:320 (-) Transcript_26808:34-993(-)